MTGGNKKSDLEAAKASAEAFYKSIGSVHCPYFKSDVLFTRPGLEHLRFKQGARQRVAGDQAIRLRLLKLVPEILSKSSTLQGHFVTKAFENVRIHNRIDCLLRPVTYYEFIAVLENYRVKVIVKQIENGPKFFWSVIPAWKRNKDSTRKLHSYQLSED